jgi:hypothetical protein
MGVFAMASLALVYIPPYINSTRDLAPSNIYSEFLRYKEPLHSEKIREVLILRLPTSLVYREILVCIHHTH